MRAVGFTEFGGPEVLGVHDLPDPHPGAGEVRIRVRAAAVNPTDVASRTGLLGVGTSRPPYIPGAEAAGVIDEVGAGSTWRIGEEVMTMAVPMSGHGGAYAEYLLAPDDSLARVPAGTSLEQAATLPMNGLTALQILELMSLSPGERLVVTGGAGVVGSLLVQLARRRGLTVIADAAPKDFPLLRSLGADHVLERGDDLAARIRAVLGDGVDAVADTALLHEKVVPALRDGGVFVSLRRWRGSPSAASVTRLPGSPTSTAPRRNSTRSARPSRTAGSCCARRTRSPPRRRRGPTACSRPAACADGSS